MDLKLKYSITVLIKKTGKSSVILYLIMKYGEPELMKRPLLKPIQDILVDGSLLKAGKYTLWTIPMENSWKVMFNSKMYPWGINLDKEAYRDLNLIRLFWKDRWKKLDLL